MGLLWSLDTIDRRRTEPGDRAAVVFQQIFEDLAARAGPRVEVIGMIGIPFVVVEGDVGRSEGVQFPREVGRCSFVSGQELCDGDV